MKERPITFSGPEVHAILDGRKTQTRRFLNTANWRPCGVIPGLPREHRFDDVLEWAHEPDVGVSMGQPGRWCGRIGSSTWTYSEPCPYGVPGDRLWVRETWVTRPLGGDPGNPRYGAPGSGVHIDYKATAPGGGNHDRPDWGDLGAHERWRPSIHMPRWASRLLLEVTEVRVQRLQDISEEDAIAEGVRSVPLQEDARGCWWTTDVAAGPDLHGRTPADAYARLWDTINGKRAPWSSNPWVWAVSFRRLP